MKEIAQKMEKQTNRKNPVLQIRAIKHAEKIGMTLQQQKTFDTQFFFQGIENWQTLSNINSIVSKHQSITT